MGSFPETLIDPKNVFSYQRLCNYPRFKQKLGTTWKCCLYLADILVVVFD